MLLLLMIMIMDSNNYNINSATNSSRIISSIICSNIGNRLNKERLNNEKNKLT